MVTYIAKLSHSVDRFLRRFEHFLRVDEVFRDLLERTAPTEININIHEKSVRSKQQTFVTLFPSYVRARQSPCPTARGS
jgi:hypothetical protein